MALQNKNNTNRLVTESGKSILNIPELDVDTPVNTERAARFLDKQKEAFANLIPLSEREKRNK